jgi:hypothetical protein
MTEMSSEQINIFAEHAARMRGSRAIGGEVSLETDTS